MYLLLSSSEAGSRGGAAFSPPPRCKTCLTVSIMNEQVVSYEYDIYGNWGIEGRVHRRLVFEKQLSLQTDTRDTMYVCTS